MTEDTASASANLAPNTVAPNTVAPNTALDSNAQREPQGAKSREFIGEQGIRLYADCYGDPSHPPVLLAHGGGQTHHAWGNTASALAAAGWYAVCYDHRGHGNSEWSADNVYSLGLFAKDQIAIAKALGQPVLIGASLGGISAMVAQGEMAEEKIFSGIVLVDILPRMNRDGAINILNFMGSKMNEGFADLDEAADEIARYTGRPRRKDISGLEKNLRQRDGRYYWHWDPGFVHSLMPPPDDEPARLTAGMARCFETYQLPTLLVRGRMSDLVDEDAAQAFLAEHPSCEFVDVEGARHMVAGDRNDAFTRAVVEFLAKLRPLTDVA